MVQVWGLRLGRHAKVSDGGADYVKVSDVGADYVKQSRVEASMVKSF